MDDINIKTISLDSQIVGHCLKDLLSMATIIQDESEGIPDDQTSDRPRPAPQIMAATFGILMEALSIAKLYSKREVIAMAKDCLLNLQNEPVEGPVRKGAEG